VYVAVRMFGVCLCSVSVWSCVWACLVCVYVKCVYARCVCLVCVCGRVYVRCVCVVVCVCMFGVCACLLFV